DLRRHHGVHPRMGALDVLPFVPLTASISDCVRLAHRAGRRLTQQLRIPVYFYGKAAQRHDRTALAAVRDGGFETLRLRVTSDPGLGPDLGGPSLHPSAGATAVGVRDVLVAYNVVLASDNLALARRIAATVRERGGGLPAVQ